MTSETQAQRWSRVSRRCLIIAVLCLAAIPLGCYAIDQFSVHGGGRDGLRALGYMLLIVFGGVGIAGCFALVSLGYGIACARECKHVLFWVVPFWLLAGCGLIAGLYELALFVDSQSQFIPSGKRDDLGALLMIWFGAGVVLSLASWLLGVVYTMRIKYFPWWSVPLWATAFLAVFLLLA